MTMANDCPELPPLNDEYDDPYRWLHLIERYFDYHHIDDEEAKVAVALKCMGGSIRRWFQAMEERERFTDWLGVRMGAFNCCGSSVDELYFDLISLQQDGGSVAAYARQFKQVSAMVLGIPESFLRDIFVFGLSRDIRNEMESCCQAMNLSATILTAFLVEMRHSIRKLKLSTKVESFVKVREVRRVLDHMSSEEENLSEDQSFGSSFPSKNIILSLDCFVHGSQSTMITTMTNEVVPESAMVKPVIVVQKHRNRSEPPPPVTCSWSPFEDGGIDRAVMDTPDKGNNSVAKHERTQRGMVLPFQPLSLAFDHVNYYVDIPTEMKNQGVKEDRLQLLRDVSGAFKPGILTALVGVSGAGKTTLMDVLAGRKTGGYIEGSISISGYPKNQATFARVSGYCEQNDIHSPNITVYESLIYSAWLRLAKEITKETRQMFVEEVMELVELKPIRNSKVGLPGVDGLSTEQRKRLTIAVELVANPSIIFMDEPTSGLDARAAAIVMRTVRNTVDTGRTVVCTIHQPSIDIFEAFDELLLMKRGGQVIYDGPLGRHSHKLVEYFETISGVPKIKDACNPATWMLDISTPAFEAQLGIDFAETYKNSGLYKTNSKLINELSTPEPGSSDLCFPTKYSQSYTTQWKACFWKQHWSYWRNPQYNAIRLFMAIVVGFLFGLIFWSKGDQAQKEQDLLNLMGAMYAAVLYLGATNTSSVQPIVAIERTIFYRERAAGMYSELPYAFAQVTIEIIYVAVQTFIYSLILYSTIGFPWQVFKFLWFYYFIFMSFIIFTLYGMMTVALTPNHQIAAIAMSFFLCFWNLFSGFLIPWKQIPIWWRWYYWASPVAWTIYGLITSQIGDVTDLVTITQGDSITVKAYLKSSFGFDYDFLGAVAAAHIGFVLLFIFVFAYGIKYLNFQRR